MASERTRLRWLVLAMVALLPLTLSFIIWAGREPRHDGRTLSEWLSQSYYERASEEETARAIQAMGSRVLPTLLDWMRTRDSRTKRAIADLAGRQSLIELRLESAEERRGIAVAGFYLLGTNAAPAIPALAALIEDPQLGGTALNGLHAIGVPAWAVLLAALTNSQRDVKTAAAGWLTSDPFIRLPGTIEAILRLLHDGDSNVQSILIHTLANCGKYPELTHPAFAELASDPNNASRRAAITAMVNARVDPAIALPVYLAAMENGEAEVRRRAVQGLSEIGTDDVIESLVKALDDPVSAIRANAASGLGKFTQQGARIVPLLHARLTNDYPVVRAGAASGLAKFGSMARIALPDLVQLYESDDRQLVLRISAARALLAIDPATAARVGIKPGETSSLSGNASAPPGRRGSTRTN